MKKTLYRLYRIICLCMLASVLTAALSAAAGCSSPAGHSIALPEPLSVSSFKLNTYVEIKGYDTTSNRKLLTEALNLCDRYEMIFSRTLPDSELSRLNRHEITTVSAPLGELISYGIEYGQLSGGSFDISIGSVSSLWDFTSGNPSVPDTSDIAGALEYVGYDRITLAKNEDGTYNVSIPDKMMLDLGAIAKGYIADRIKDYLTDNGVKSALINLGGNVLCIGNRPDNSAFNVRVRRPFAESSAYICSVNASDMSVVSSGTYERCFTYGGNFYHHILNPADGYPYNNGLTQVTIFSKTSVTGDCMSTACFTLGLDKGLSLVENTDGVEAVFVTEDGSLHYSSGAKQYLQEY